MKLTPWPLELRSSRPVTVREIQTTNSSAEFPVAVVLFIYSSVLNGL